MLEKPDASTTAFVSIARSELLPASGGGVPLKAESVRVLHHNINLVLTPMKQGPHPCTLTVKTSQTNYNLNH
jgi:hypothetical protein